MKVRDSVFFATLAAATASTWAQDLYDTTVLRTMAFTFSQPNWETLLRNNYVSQVNIPADLTVDGVTYPNVGVRIRGNTSYTSLPAGSQKFSLNVEIDYTDPNLRIMGYQGLNLNNGFHDPTFCREVLYNNYVSQFMPNSRANHVLVTINGQNWGVYNNVQQVDKIMYDKWFGSPDGLRIKCPNNPGGPGLRYNGATASGYNTAYEIKDAGGFADPWAPHITVCNTLSNAATANWQTTIDPIVAVDPSIWSVMFENILTDDDSYVNKGADFVTYRDPTDGRTFILQTDANETFTLNWAFNFNFTNTTTRPFLNRVLGVPELRQRYLAHYRTAKQDLSWAGYFEPRATALRALIEPHVNADPKKIYTFAQFQQNFTTSVALGCSGPCGGTVPGLSQFITSRLTTLNASAELVANGPSIASVFASDDRPDPADAVTITAVVNPNGSAVNRVDLYYRPAPNLTYQRVQMNSSGGSDYTAALPVVGSPGKTIKWYVGATASNTYLSQTFLPAHTEWIPNSLTYTFGSTGGMRITEFMYDGPSGSFVEFTNISNSPIDMTGWSMDDDHNTPGTIPLSAFGTVQPGESVLVTEQPAATFRGSWSLSPNIKIIDGMGGAIGNNLSRNDAIALYQASNAIVDRLVYGDQNFPGTVRANNTSAQTAGANIGQDDISLWQLSSGGDAFGSWSATTGEAGTPGLFGTPPAVCDSIDFNNDTLLPDTGDIDDFLSVFSGGPCSTDPAPGCNDVDFNNDTLFPDTVDIDALLSVFSGGPCLV